MRHLLALYLTAVVFTGLAGCAASPPSKFYILSPVPTDATVHSPGSATAIGVGPVELPRYLDRPQIAMRTGANELSYDETHRWAEALKDNVTNVLAENLARLVPADKVSIFPWGRTTTIDYQVVAKISRFDADASGTVVLSADWRLYRGETREIVDGNKTVYKEPFRGEGFADIVAAQSRALDALSRDIADAIRKAADR
jgi:uncharacterized lipoprotein YmbA